jgi:hypothetical protein
MKQKGPGKKIVGENTGKVKRNKKGKPFTMISSNTTAGMKKGDTIMLPKGYPKSKGSNMLSGGSYTVQKLGPKKYGKLKSK